MRQFETTGAINIILTHTHI